MKAITLITLGKETAVHYLLALGAQLQQRGMNACLAAAPAFGPLARKAGLRFQPLAADQASLENPGRELLRQVQELARNASLMVVHQASLAVVQAAGPLPCLVTGLGLEASELFSRIQKKGGLLGRVASWIKEGSRNGAGPYVPTLYNFSPQLLPGKEAESSTLHFTGQWAIPDSLQWKLSGRAPSPALNDWLYHGGRPVFFDLSQAPEEERELLLGMVKGLSEKMGFRALVCAPWESCKEGLLQRDIFRVAAPVQEWLFQQCAAVIHYRSSEKLPAAIRAGVPSILCASGTEAQGWGEVLQQRGIGIHLRREPLAAAALEAALEQALRLSMQYKAKAMGKALREENGLEYAANVICRQAEEKQMALAV